MKKLAVLISDTGTGTNLQAIIDAIEEKKLQAEIAIVVSDTQDAQGLKRAEKYSLTTVVVDRQTDLVRLLSQDHQVDYVCLAGWKQIIAKEFIDAFPHRILNLHPGLIPDTIDSAVKNPDGSNGLWNKGKLTKVAIQEFLSARATYAGSSIHFLTHEFDFGPVLGRTFESIQPDDTVDTLYKRLKHKENALYVAVLQKLCNT